MSGELIPRGAIGPGTLSFDVFFAAFSNSDRGTAFGSQFDSQFFPNGSVQHFVIPIVFDQPVGYSLNDSSGEYASFEDISTMVHFSISNLDAEATTPEPGYAILTGVVLLVFGGVRVRTLKRR